MSKYAIGTDDNTGYYDTPPLYDETWTPYYEPWTPYQPPQVPYPYGNYFCGRKHCPYDVCPYDKKYDWPKCPNCGKPLVRVIANEKTTYECFECGNRPKYWFGDPPDFGTGTITCDTADDLQITLYSMC